MTALIYEIHTGDCKPVKQPPHRIPTYQWEVINQQLEELFAIWSSAVVRSRKHDRTYYIYIEYCTLNQLTKKNTIPLHRTDDVLEPLGGVQCVPLGTGICEWSKRIVLRLPSQLIRAHKVQFQWRVMPFGSTNRPAIFIPFISIFHLVLIDLNWTHCLVYFDDIIIRALIFEDHIHCLRLLFDHTRTAGFETEAYQVSLP